MALTDAIDAPVIARMRMLVTQWDAAAEQRAIVLACYVMMTRSMLATLERALVLAEMERDALRMGGIIGTGHATS
jgi:hypothetical protein